MQTVLTIAGFDPSSGAGVTADLMVFAAHGLFGTSAITSLTVQSTTGVRSSEPATGRTLAETLDCLHADLPPAGIKLGMLATSEAVEVVAGYLERVRRSSDSTPIVLDPVVRSSSGRELLDARGVELLKERLLPLVSWVTPNLPELSLLTGERVETPLEVVSAARSLQRCFPNLNVLATGGHLERPDDLLVAAGREPQWIPGEHIESRSTHGTGCALSSALLSRLVLGDGPQEAAARAKEYVAEAIRRAVPLGFGNGPLNHLWPLR
jgi:hydroxymethylpyrimidine/phosphomethylpyrimidine kinase